MSKEISTNLVIIFPVDGKKVKEHPLEYETAIETVYLLSGKR